MNFLEKRKIRLKVLTPIFIGSGEVTKPFSYLLEGNTVHLLDEDKFFAQLSQQEQERYQEWVESFICPLGELDDQIRQARDDLDKRRELLRKRREIETGFSLWHFLANVLKTRPLSFMSGCEAYAARCAIPPERDGFRLCMKDIMHRPYVPGTEIKGALRTVMLYALLNESRNYPWLSDRLSQVGSLFNSEASPRDKIRKFEKVSNDLEARMLRGEERGEIKDDARFDFLRMLHVSDSTPLPPTALRVELTQTLGTRRPTKTWVETISSDSEFCFQVDLDDSPFLLEKLGLVRFREWLSFSKLLDACFNRSRDILEEEARYFAKEPRVKKLIAELQRANNNVSPLLRLGQGQGFLGITVDLSVMRRDQTLYDKVIREGVTLQRKWRTLTNNFPKTRRVISDQGGAATSFLGWCKVLS